MVRRLVAATATAAAFALGLAGCGSDPGTAPGATTTSAPAATTTSGTSANGDAVAWAEKVCSSVAPHVDELDDGPKDIDGTDPNKAKAGMSAYLDKLSGALDSMTASFKEAGDPPVANGDQLSEKAVGSLDEAKKIVDGAKVKLEGVNTADPAAFQSGFLQVGQDLQKLGDLEDPTKGLRGNKELEEAFKAAPTCKKLDDAEPESEAASESPSETASPRPTS
ncbi:hypothetical protein [Actinokineospora iranica]|uniref:Small secreted protein n=1 Tax=Actinokineospora iranica TaxID=1271860 RepID=A0A1G6XW72_9PSEU|nr:hypothetical protein [Actinokineospora iranica]SDD82231.1 hypothetical protein SAMN05216174_11924 [Actinokineospora iranica]